MTGWPTSELDTIADADELHVTTRRPDGSLRQWVPIWVVRIDDTIYVRSYRGAGGAWYRHAAHGRSGLIRVPGLQREVTFDPAADGTADAIDTAYRVKYAHYGPTYLTPMLADAARATTLQITPTPTPAVSGGEQPEGSHFQGQGQHRRSGTAQADHQRTDRRHRARRARLRVRVRPVVLPRHLRPAARRGRARVHRRHRRGW
jgi:hypothetical protein